MPAAFLPLAGPAAARGAGRTPAPSLSLPGCLLPRRQARLSARPPSSLLLPRLSKEMAGPQAGAPGVLFGAVAAERCALRAFRLDLWGSLSAGLRSGSGSAPAALKGQPRTVAELRGAGLGFSPDWAPSAGPAGTDLVPLPCALRPASGRRLALLTEARGLRRSGREARVAGLGAARQGW